ncbi:MAG: peptide MFS transporter [Micrococcaceae bacterium]
MSNPIDNTPKKIESLEGGPFAARALEENTEGPGLEEYPSDTSFFGHPKQMATLFGVETWERFSYYGLQGIVLLYMYYSVAKGGLGMTQAEATSVVGAYGGGLYLSSILMGWLADRVLGRERTLFYSAIVVMIGHLTLAFLTGIPGLVIGIFCIAVGGGGVKAASTSMVGSLYPKGDTRLGSGFALYYLGINLGGLIGPLATGYLQSTKGFHYGFGLAAIGMALGLAQYALTRKNLPESTRRVNDPLSPEEKKKLYTIIAVGVIVVAILIATHIINIDDASNAVIVISVITTFVLYYLMIKSPKVDQVERDRIWASVPLFVSSVAFWALYQQQFTVLTIYADKRLNRHIGNWEMPVAWVQSINPIYIILLSGFFAGLWAKWKGQPGTISKFAWANIFIGLAFFMFLPFANGPANSAPLLLICVILFVFTIGEMFLSPVSLAVSTQLAPKAYTTQMVAMFFLASGIGTSLAGTLAGYYNPDNEVPYFLSLGIASILVGFVMFGLKKWVNNRMHGVL